MAHKTGWLDDPIIQQTDSSSIILSSITEPSFGSRLKQSMDAVMDKAVNLSSTFANPTNKHSFEQWFFASGTMANFEKGNIVILAFFTMLIAIGLILTLATIVLIIYRPRTTANAILFHFYAAQLLFCISMIVRTAQMQLNPCARSLGGFAFYAETLSTPMCQISLCLLAIERLVYVSGFGSRLRCIKKCMEGTFVTHTILICAWTVLAIVVMLMSLVLKMFMKAASALMRAKTLSKRETEKHIICEYDPSHIPMGLLKDVLIALFAVGVVIPAVVNVLSHTWLLTFGRNVAVLCSHRRKFMIGTPTRLAILLTLNHIVLSFPHILMSLFVSTIGRAYKYHAVFMIFKSVEVLISAFLFLCHSQFFLTKYLRCNCAAPEIDQVTSASRSNCDIESLINTINVGRHDISNGMTPAGGFANSTAITGLDAKNSQQFLTRSLPQDPPHRFRRSPIDASFPINLDYTDNFDPQNDPVYISTESNFRSARPYFDRPTTQIPRERIEPRSSRHRTPPRPPYSQRDERMTISRKHMTHNRPPPIPPTPAMSSTSSRARSMTRSQVPPPIPPRRTPDSRNSTLIRNQNVGQTPRSSQRRLPAHSSRRTHSRSASVGAGQMAEYRFSRDEELERPRSQHRPDWDRPRQNWFQSTITNEEEV